MTAGVVNLVEWGGGETVRLTDSEAAVLRRLEGSLRVTWQGANEATIAPRDGVVGIVSLSPATTITVRPKWPVASLLELAAFAYGLDAPPELPREEAMVEQSGPADWLALLLTSQVERLLAQGIRQGYCDVDDELPYVRGRIDFGALRPGREKPCLVPCRFSDFVVDTIENRIVRGTMELLATAPLCASVRRRLRDTLSAFVQVRLVPVTAQMFDRVHLDRLNAHYRPALELCRLALENAGVELRPGEVAGSAFFFRTSEVFERALGRALEEASFENVNWQPTYGDRIRVLSGGPPWSVGFRPDFVIGPRSAPRLVVDAKYKRPTSSHWETERFLASDLYQAFTYAAALRVSVVLVYPQVEGELEITLGLDDHRVLVCPADIGRLGVAGLRGLAEGLMARCSADRLRPTCPSAS